MKLKSISVIGHRSRVKQAHVDTDFLCNKDTYRPNLVIFFPKWTILEGAAPCGHLLFTPILKSSFMSSFYKIQLVSSKFESRNTALRVFSPGKAYLVNISLIVGRYAVTAYILTCRLSEDKT